MKIETQTATVDTCAISIKTLQISKKQVTLAVFRQFPILGPDIKEVGDKYMEIIDDNGNLKSEISVWGLVRYNIKNEASLWAVLSYNDCLYRHIIDHAWKNIYNVNINSIKNQEERLQNFLQALEKAKEVLKRYKESDCITNWRIGQFENNIKEQEENINITHQNILYYKKQIPITCNIQKTYNFIMGQPQLFIAV